MKVILENNLYSLLPFEADLPKFTLITGLNGSGKTQLLSAISTGQIRNDIAVVNEIQHFGPNMFRLSGSRPELYEGYDSATRRADFLGRTAALNADLRQRWLDWSTTNSFDNDTLMELTRRVHAAINKPPSLDYFFSDKTDELYDLQELIIELNKSSITRGTPSHDGSFDANLLLSQTQAHWGIPYFLLNSRQLSDAVAVAQPLFHVSLGAIFTKYRDDDLRNRINRIAFDKGETKVPPLSDEEFADEKGPPPWDLINSLLSDLDVEARFEAPPFSLTSFYEPVMVTRNGTRFAPSQLSSGEEVILALATIGYAATDRHKIWSAPALVLLDEVDAPLHPAMAKTYLRVIKEVLIDKFGMHVIATSHSPSTIAQADVQDVFVMKKGQAGVSRIPKETALAVLTEGVPTLSVSISSRRQVFAESPVEAANLDRLYQILRPTFNSELSLQFIATGTKQTNSSKSDVERIVGDLIEAGNTSVYGIIDWDTTNSSTERIKVIAAGRRYALENIILDPLILGTFLYRELDKESLAHYGLDADLDVFSLKSLHSEDWQAIANSVTQRVMGKHPDSVVDCSYHGGLTVQIDQAYLQHNAHKLEDRVVAAYPMLEKMKMGGSGKITAHLIDNVLRHLPVLIPVEVEQVFGELLTV